MGWNEARKDCAVLAGAFEDTSTSHTARPLDTTISAWHWPYPQYGPKVTTLRPSTTCSSLRTPASNQWPAGTVTSRLAELLPEPPRATSVTATARRSLGKMEPDRGA